MTKVILILTVAVLLLSVAAVISADSEQAILYYWSVQLGRSDKTITEYECDPCVPILRPTYTPEAP